MICSRDGSLMAEDTDFAREAFREGVTVRRFYGLVCGHSVYDPPTLKGRGWEPGTPAATCNICGDEITAPKPGLKPSYRFGRGFRCPACRTAAAPVTRCTVCGGPVRPPRRTCSDACLAARMTKNIQNMRRTA